jgi:DNA mismatch endonuclease (patch repair protein)
LVFPGRRAVLFVHGCFWHGHGCHLFRIPATRTEFWREKITGNVERDIVSAKKLHSAGWRVGIVWECALKGREKRPLQEITAALAAWLRSGENELELRGLT